MIDWLLPMDRETLLWLSATLVTGLACTMTPRFVQFRAVPTSQKVRLELPSPIPVNVTCVPLVETETTVGVEFAVI